MCLFSNVNTKPLKQNEKISSCILLYCMFWDMKTTIVLVFVSICCYRCQFFKMPCEVGEKIYNRLLKCFQVILKILLCACVPIIPAMPRSCSDVQQMASFFDCFSLKINSRCELSILFLWHVSEWRRVTMQATSLHFGENNAPSRIKTFYLQ